jgi:hypothetical protein
MCDIGFDIKMQIIIFLTNKKNIMKLTFKVLAIICLGLLSQTTYAQLSGSKTVPGDYASLAAAITDLNTVGVNGPLTITVSQNETAPAGGYVINSFTGASATNTVTIVASGTRTLTAPVGTSTTVDAIIKLNGCDYVTIDGFTIQESAGNTTANTWMEWGIAMVAPTATNGVQFCTIQNCTVSLTRSYANTGIYARQHTATAATAVAPTSAAGAHSNNTIINNTIQNCLTGVLLHGHSAFPGQGNKVGNTSGTGNTITVGNNATSTATAARGIVLAGQQGCIASNNSISTASAPSHSNSIHGIYLGSTSFDGGTASNYTISNNTISLTTTTDVGRLFGIRMEAMASATVTNNTIQNCSAPNLTTGGADGITLASAVNITTSLAITNNNIINNTFGGAATTTAIMTLINLEGASSNTVPTMAITGNQLINNTFNGSATASGAHRGIQCLHNSNVSGTVSNNTIRNLTFASTGIVYALNFQNQSVPSPGTILGTVSGNTIRNVKGIGTTGTLEVLRAYTTTNSSVDINNNTITNCGYPNTSGTTNVTVRGISSSNSAANIINCNNNVIDTAFILGTNTATNSLLRGIQIDAFAFAKNINNNTISNIELGIRSSGSSYSCGIRYGSGYSSVISGNNIRNIGYTAPGANTGVICGMSFGYPDDSVIVRNNFISGIYAKNTSLSANMQIIGIDQAAGNSGLKVKLYNNTIVLDDAQNANNGVNLFASGIRFGAPSTNVPTVDIRNNIVNVQVTPGSLGNTMALRRESGTAGVVPANFTSTSNNNIYYVTPVATCPGCFVYGEGYAPVTNGFTNDGNFNTACSGYASLFAPRESASRLENNLVAGTTLGTFVPSGTSFAEAGGQAISFVATDFAGVTRSTPPDCGALEFSGTAITSGDVTAPAIAFTNLINSICTNANSLTATITDASGINTNAGTKPRLWYKKSTELDALPASNTSADNGWKYVEASNAASPFVFNFDYSLFNTPLAGGDVVQYFVVAQDLNGNMGNSQISYPTSYCPTSVALSAGAFPLATTLAPKSFNIITTPVNVTTAASVQFVCDGTGTTFSLTGDLATGASYQWENAVTNSGPWNSIAGANSITYPVTLTTTSPTNYRCVITCGSTTVTTSAPIEVAVYPLLSGTYTIDKNAPISPTNFISFSAAAAALNCGVSGPVVINVVPNQTDFTDRFLINVISGASATNTITINGNGNKLKFNSLTLGTTLQFDQPNTMLLNGSDYVTVNDLIVEANDPSNPPYALAVHLANQADNNSFNNCTFIAPQVANNNGQFAPFSISGSASSATTAGNGGNNNTVNNCKLIGGSRGCMIVGSTTNLAKNNKIINSTVRDFRLYGIMLQSTDAAVVSRDTIEQPNTTAAQTSADGIFVASSAFNPTPSQDVLIERNVIRKLFGNVQGSTNTCNGISCASPGIAGKENKIYNNLIYDIKGLGTTTGINLSNVNYLKVYHNTISLDNTAATGSLTATSGITHTATTTAGAADIRNNIITITRGGLGLKYCLTYNSTVGARISNNNVLFIKPAPTNSIATNGTAFATLAAWKAANTAAYDQNSYDFDPLYADAISENYKPNNGLINDKGAAGLGVATDFAGVTRSATPDPGAYEFDVTTPDASLAWLSPAGTQTAGVKTITVNVTNVGAGTINSLDMSYYDGVGTNVNESFTGLNIAPGATVPITFATTYNLAFTVNMTVTIGDVNGAPESFTPNNTVVQYFCIGLSGTYTIDQGTPTGGTNFASFTDAITGLSCGIFGPVTFNVVNNNTPFYESIEILPIAGSSSTNTVTFNGNGATISYLTNAIKPSTVMMYGADNIIFNNLIIESTATGASANAFACHLWGQADNNKFNKCTFKVDLSTTSSASSSAFSISGGDISTTTAGISGNNNVLDSCTVIGGFNAVSFYGPTAAGSANTGNQVKNCLIQDFHGSGINAQYQNGIIVRGNIVERPNRTTSSTAYGIFISSGCLNAVTDKNIIRNLFTSVPATHTNQGNGIASNSTAASAGNENIFTNNIIYGFTGSGSVNGIYLLSATNVKVYYNSILINDQLSNQSSTTPTYGIYASGSTNIDIRNNNVSVTRAGAGSKFCLFFTTNSPSSNYNNLHLAAPTGTNFIGANGTSYPTLSAWQAGSGKDANSVAVNPQFVNTTTGNLKPTAAALDNKATPIASVTTDFFGTARNASTPDVGAYEFDPADSDAAITWNGPITPLAAGSNTISVNVTNVGLTTITSLVMSYTDGGTPVSQTFTGLNIATGDAQVLSFTTPYNFTQNVNITVTQTRVNNINDPSPSNSTITQNVCIGLAGVYTIDPATAPSATNFVSFTGFVNALGCGGVVGPVIVNVAPSSPPFNEQIEFLQVVGTSATNTITINGNGNKLTYFVASGSNLSTLLFSGADYFTINNLEIEGNVLTVHLWNDSDFNTFNKCKITSPATSPGINQPTTATFSVSPSKNSFNTAFVQVNSGNDNIKLDSCTIIGGYSGVSFVASNFTGSPKDYNNEVLNSSITDGLVRQVYGSGQTNFKVINCLMERPTAGPNGYGFMGIDLSNSINGLFENNILRNAYPNGTSSGNSTRAINSDGTEATGNKFINNLIYNMNAPTQELYGILLGSSNENTVLHNTIVLDHQATVSGGSHGIFVYGNTSNVIKNNLVYITRNGTGDNIGLDYGSTSGKSSDNNNIYVNSPTGGNYIGRVNSTNYSTLTAWNTLPFATLDTKSVSLDPMFVSSSDYTPTNLAMNNKGATGLGITKDIFGTTRKTYPDVGAIEFGINAPILTAKVFLNHVSNNLMSDYMPTLANFPTSDPYSTTPLNLSFTHVMNGTTQTTTPIVLSANDNGGDDIVDWVFLELRDGVSGSTSVLYTQAALLQRDGDIVNAANGLTEVEFPNAPIGDYYVAVRHRDHLGFRTANKIAMNNNTPALNFTNSSVTLFGAYPTTTVSGVEAMNGGDSNSDGSIDAFDTIVWETQNGLFDDYDNNSDYNLDGSVDAFDTILWELNNGKYNELD